MRKPKRVIFWQNELAMHQSATIRAFSERDIDCEVISVAECDVSEERKALGWVVNDAGRTRIVVSPDKAAIQQLVAAAPRESVHICSGIGAFPMVYEAFKQCLGTNTCLGVFSESSDSRGLPGIGRRVLWRTNALRYSRKIDFLLAAGAIGVDWFVQSGFPEQKVHPFGYFMEAPRLDAPHAPSGVFKLLYVGQYVPRKGVDILLRALAQCKELPWKFVGVGMGEQQSELLALASQLGIASRVALLPPVPNPSIPAVMSTADVLVLPSHFDGWGAVINEALMCGVPVICSDQCGAADLLGAAWRGAVFKAGSVSDLSAAISRKIVQGKRTFNDTLRLQEWACRIQVETAADYLYQVILAAQNGTTKPPVPWRQNNNSEVKEDFFQSLTKSGK